MSRIISLATLALLATVGLLLAACADDDDSSEPTPTPALSPSATPAAESQAATLEPFEGGRDPVEEPFDGLAPPVCTLVDVRVDEHLGYDRAVFEFADCLPGYRVEYVGEAVQCGSGISEEVAGEALLQMNATPAMAHDEAGMTTIPFVELAPGLTAILELDSICDFEGYVTWVMGLSAEADFRVQAVSEPFQLIVDVAAP